MSEHRSWTAIVLAGGRSSRMGRDKLTVDIGGSSSVVRVLADLGTGPVIVVGSPPEGWAVPGDCLVIREDPPFSGPAAAIGAALPHVRTPVVAVLAGDMPFAVPVATAAVGHLTPVVDACIPVDSAGRRQHLCAAYRTDALRAAAACFASLVDLSVRTLLDGLSIAEFPAPDDGLVDLDVLTDVERARRLAGGIADTGRRIRSKGHVMDEWIAAVCRELRIEPTVDVPALLDIARDAAHSVERPAAPVTTYLAGWAIATGADPADVSARLAALAAGWTAPE